MSKLREELQGDDYKQKLGGLVSQLYKLAFQTYHDIPRRPIKVDIQVLVGLEVVLRMMVI